MLTDSLKRFELDANGRVRAAPARHPLSNVECAMSVKHVHCLNLGALTGSCLKRSLLARAGVQEPRQLICDRWLALAYGGHYVQ